MPMKKLIFFLLFASISLNARADCIEWGNVMTKYDIKLMTSSKTSVLVQQFDDFTKRSGDSWLSFGIARLLADYISTGNDINVLQGAISKYHPSAVSPTFVVNGMFQHTEGQLRIFVKLFQKNDLKKQLQIDIPYPGNRQLFDSVGDAALSLLAIINPPYDQNKFSRVRSATSSMPAYENYVRGLISYQSFDPDQMDIAKAWFEESLKNDVNFQNAYLGLVDTYIFLAMYNKQNRSAFGGYFEKAEKTLSDMDRFAKRQPVPERPKRFVIKVEEKQFTIANRFLLANSSFIAGLNAAGSKQWINAGKYFEEALELTPEDAITWWHLSQTREKTGDKQKAASAKKKAVELNKCLQ